MDLTQNGMPPTDCILYSKGNLFCVPAMKYTTQCLGNYALWPYDKQNCTITFGSWSHSGEEINYSFEDKGVNICKNIQSLTIFSYNIKVYLWKF